MTGIERLRKLADEYAEIGKHRTSLDVMPGGMATLFTSIADQTEREQDKVAQTDWEAVRDVRDDMSRHVFGIAETDALVERWIRTLSDALDGRVRQVHDPAADVSMSAYDLLPEEEREAIAWVREHGGLGAVKKMADITLDVYQRLVDGSAGPEMLETDADTVDAMMAEIVEVVVKRGKEYTRALDLLNESVPRVTYERHIIKRQRQIDESHAALRRKNKRIEDLEAGSRDLQDADNRRVELSSALGVDTETGWADAMAEMCRRLMPEGMEWPRFDDGKPVRVGDEFMGKDGKTYTVKQIQLIGKFYALYDFCDAKPQFVASYGERVKRPAPKVLDADGVEIRVGDTVWDVEYGCEYVVTKVAEDVVFAAFEDAAASRFDPSSLTHRATVLAADGRPLCEGETVWVTKDSPCAAPLAKGDEVTVKHAYPKTISVEDRAGDSWIVYNDHLTHERPDSWERLEEDAMKPACLYFNHVGVDCVAEPKCPAYGSEVKCGEKKTRDLVRRAKALAGGA